MLKLSDIPRQLADLDLLRLFADRSKERADQDPYMGFDTESSAEEYPDGVIAGFSLYFKPINHSIYVPLRHCDPVKNVSWDAARPILQELFDDFNMVAHSWSADGVYMVRDGITLKAVTDTFVLSNTLQAQNAGLKDQVLEYHLVDFREVVGYRQIVAEAKGYTPEQLDQVSKGKDNDPNVWGFHTIDVTKSQKAVEYACNDAIWARELLPILVKEHDSLVGDQINAEIIRQANDFSTALLAESSAAGYIVHPEILKNHIDARVAEVNAEEQDLLNEVRKHMGWGQPTEPVAMPNLFE